MRIGQIAGQAGVNIQTLRYYERRGLLRPVRRLASGYREYDIATVPLVRFIKNAQELGFTLREIGELIELRSARSRSQLKVRQLATAKIEEVDRRIRDLTAIRAELVGLVEQCKTVGTKKDCVIIEAMDGSGTAVSATACQQCSPNGGNRAES